MAAAAEAMDNCGEGMDDTTQAMLVRESSTFAYAAADELLALHNWYQRYHGYFVQFMRYIVTCLPTYLSTNFLTYLLAFHSTSATTAIWPALSAYSASSPIR